MENRSFFCMAQLAAVDKFFVIFLIWVCRLNFVKWLSFGVKIGENYRELNAFDLELWTDLLSPGHEFPVEIVKFPKIVKLFWWFIRQCMGRNLHKKGCTASPISSSAKFKERYWDSRNCHSGIWIRRSRRRLKKGPFSWRKHRWSNR